MVARVRPAARRQDRCLRCGRRCFRYDNGGGRRRWLGCGARCTGCLVAATPWVRPGARFTRAAEDQAAWLAAHMAGSRVAELLRITWLRCVAAAPPGPWSPRPPRGRRPNTPSPAGHGR
ncbi:transposase family protein [Lentzea sp. E54]|uniref:transposase family protein n=1 Tax=Lentzea xerophila TaxID=3435883 RepID=UPI003DA2451C